MILTDLLLLTFLIVFSSLASSSSYTGCTSYISYINYIDYISYIGCIGCAYIERSISIARISASSSIYCASITTLKVNNKRSASIARILALSSTHYTSIKTLIIILDRFDANLITWFKIEILTKFIFEVYLNR